jgi:hypothetical protein
VSRFRLARFNGLIHHYILEYFTELKEDYIGGLRLLIYL